MKKMFGFPRRRKKLGRLKVQLSESQGTRSPIRNTKCQGHSNGESVAPTSTQADELNRQSSSSSGTEVNKFTVGNSESWMVLSTAGDNPAPRFNHAAAVVGNKMVVVGGESDHGLLGDVRVLNFDKCTWTISSSKLFLSPSLPLKIPACKGHCLVSWGTKVLLIGGKTDPGSDRISVWAFDTEAGCWSLMEAKGDIPIARSGHTVVRAGSVLILFGGEGAKRKKLNDLHMFDLKSQMWLPLHCMGTGPSPRSNHVAALYDDRVLFVFGGAAKSRTLNDLYSLDFETMIWSRLKIRDFHPSPRAGCCGVLCGTKWYIAGGGSRKKRHAETLVFDVVKLEWSVALVSPSSSITTSKGFSLVHVQHKEKVLLVAFGGSKKELSNQVEILIMEKNEQSMGHGSMPEKGLGFLLFENGSTQFSNGAPPCLIDAVAKQNLASALELHGSARRSISEFSAVKPHTVSGNVSLQKQFHNKEDYNTTSKILKNLEDKKSLQAMEQKTKVLDSIVHTDVTGGFAIPEKTPLILDSENFETHQKQVNENPSAESDDMIPPEIDGGISSSLSIYQLYGTKMASLMRENGILEAQLEAALENREAKEKELSFAIQSKQEMEKKMVDMVKEMELLKEKLANMEFAHEEANSLSNIVHSDNVRLEHDVAFLKAVLDDTQKELHSTRGVLNRERERAFQLQVEVFHLKQRLQSLENRAPTPTPRKPFHM